MDTFMEDYFKQFPNISFLNNKSELYNGYCFIGSTLWSYIKDPIFSINDIYQIPKLDYVKYNSLNQKCVEFIKKELEQNDNCIILTHHLPSKKFIDKKYNTIKDRPYQQWFYSDMDSVIDLYHNKIKCWFYGHTHTPSTYQLNDISFLCNPIGYPGENNKVELNKQFVLH
jgi:hypothetical protein